MLVLEWLYNEVPSVRDLEPSGYDSPPLRFGELRKSLSLHSNYADTSTSGYTLASMCISIVISACLQFFVLRTPARRQLRLQIAAVTFALSSYNTLLQSNASSSDSTTAEERDTDSGIDRSISSRPPTPHLLLPLKPSPRFSENSSSASRVFRPQSSPSDQRLSSPKLSRALLLLSRPMVSPLDTRMDSY